MRIASYRRTGRLVPRARRGGLRAGAVVLKPGTAMEWHSTRAREELLVALVGRVHVEIQRASARRIRTALQEGQCAWFRRDTLHRVVNRSARPAHYLYITAPSR